MSLMGIIGGSGLSRYPELVVSDVVVLDTPYGKPSAAITIGKLGESEVAFLPRHGDNHAIAPHKINYRANIHALSQLGVTDIIAVAAVGGITTDFGPGALAVPDQLIDYTYGREQSFYSDDFSVDKHIDFTWPYTESLRQNILHAATTSQLKVIAGATYGAVQGPRLETAAEIRRMARDGCDIVGMTGMPEAYLARELELNYATLAVVANWAAGIAEGELTMQQISETLADGIDNVRMLIAGVIALHQS
ncbi:5'-methylthioadenosine phosphorylase [Methylophaga thiooxydans]|uniref:Probable S-methyl-5'-thioinosine phosphorylase n=1 Tax=Methylophaga thiooxydans TaxID=392484 RepID=A0A0A0BET0_9GAMM|nr:S-methyl-5'-thioinosine phosphorylase [Methylophaga thiooxydans]KGM06471.1 5'-methylthioadenosine phosphorylase [Methylophaga thiooxydans]